MWVCSCACMQGESYVNFHMKAFLSSSSARSPNAVPSLCISTPASPPLFHYPYLYVSMSRATPSPSHYCVLVCLVDLSTSLLFHHCDLELLVYFQDMLHKSGWCAWRDLCVQRIDSTMNAWQASRSWCGTLTGSIQTMRDHRYFSNKLKHAIALTKPQWHPDWKTRHRLVLASWLYLLMRTWHKDSASLCCHYCNSKK